LGKRSHELQVDKLSRLLVYILGHRPDEFGLVPDGNGFVPFKELLQALHEEADWRYVRGSHINEVLLGKDRSLFETRGKAIRVLQRRWRMELTPPGPPLPRLLFLPVRTKAHPVVMEKGVKAPEGSFLVLTPEENMARRIGRRRDQHPVLLQISAASAAREGAFFYPFGNLFLCPHISPEFIAGPPVSKEALEWRRVKAGTEEKARPRPREETPGTFVLDMARDPDPTRRAKGKKRKGWKEEARKLRRRGKR